MLNSKFRNKHTVRAIPKVWSGLFLLFILSWSACTLPAQKSSSIQKIRTLYQDVNTSIARCTGPDEPCGYYVNTVELNRKEDPWPAIGIYHSVQDFWYTGGMTEDGPHHDLHKINVNTQRSARSEWEEYLFDSAGQLVFYYFKLGEDGEIGQEFRFYFDNGKLLKYLAKVSPEEKDYQRWEEKDAIAILQEGKRLQKLFLYTLSEN